MKSLVFITSFICCISTVWSSNILGIFPMPGYSHYTLGQRLLEELANKGHNVTMISPFRENRKIKNYNEIHLEGLTGIIKEVEPSAFIIGTQTRISQIVLCYKLGYKFSNFTLHYQPVINLINSNKIFDVVITEHFFNEALLAIPFKLSAPVVYVTPTVSSLWNNHLVANPAPLSYVPKVISNYNEKITFFERLDNLFQYIIEELYRRLIAFPTHDDIIQDAFPGIPELNTLMYSKSPFILVNSHVSINDPFPHVPNMVEIGGFHTKEQELPSSLKKYLDESINGVILFGMGSLFKSSLLPVNKRDAILNALGKVKQNVLLKWEEDHLPRKPTNVKISKWFPQQAILAHPNTKAFISHGGSLSTIEAVYYGVPIIGIPIFGDQPTNINNVVRRGYGLSIPFTELTEESLDEALHQVFNNASYRQNIKAGSALMRDRRIPPLEEAIYWVEHVIKHNGSAHFKSAAMALKWYEYEMIDVAVLLIIIMIIMLFIFYKVAKGLITKCLIKRHNYNDKKNC